MPKGACNRKPNLYLQFLHQLRDICSSTLTDGMAAWIYRLRSLILPKVTHAKNCSTLHAVSHDFQWRGKFVPNQNSENPALLGREI